MAMTSGMTSGVRRAVIRQILVAARAPTTAEHGSRWWGLKLPGSGGGVGELVVDRPAEGAQRRDQGLNGCGQHGKLGKAERLTHTVLQVQILHVDPGVADVAQQPTQRTRLI